MRYLLSTLVTLISLIALLGSGYVFYKTQVNNPTICLSDNSAVLKIVQDSTVIVSVPETGNFGTGTTIKTSVGSFVLTAAHVVSHARHEEAIEDKTVVTFSPVQIIKPVFERGLEIERLQTTATVVRYSDVDAGDDLCLLKLADDNFAKTSVDFDLTEWTLPIGTELYHCGTFRNPCLATSVTTGILSQHGRKIPDVDKILDQIDVRNYKGSSGGPVFNKATGKVEGILVRGIGDSLGLIVPAWRMQSWAQKNNVEFIIDHSKPAVSLEELAKGPVEDVTPKPVGEEIPPPQIVIQIPIPQHPVDLPPGEDLTYPPMGHSD
jgi:S1-C subfamily serine protease